jgi:hypothetical protein
LEPRVALELMRNIVEQARAGNLAATAMVLKRIWPVRRNRPIETRPLPGDGLRNLHADHAALAAAMMNGDITPQEGEAAVRLFKALQKQMRRVDDQEDCRASATRPSSADA